MKELPKRSSPNTAGWFVLAMSATLSLEKLTAGYFSRFLADDLCMGGSLSDNGFWGAQKWWYLNWDGRYSFTFVIHSILLLRPQMVGGLVAGAMVMFCVLTTVVWQRIAGLLKLEVPLIVSAGLGLLLAATVTFLTPNPIQSLFWPSGLTTYFLPIIIFEAIVLLCFSKLSIKHEYLLVVSGLLSIVGAGTSEIAAIFYILVFGTLAMLGAYNPRLFSRQSRDCIAAVLAASVIGFAIVFFAPGNAIRQARFPDQPNLYRAIKTSIPDLLKFFMRELKVQPLVFAFFLLSFGASGMTYGNNLGMRRRDMVLGIYVIATIVYVFDLVLFIPAVYVADVAPPPDRLLIVLLFILLAGLGSCAFLVGSIARASVKSGYLRYSWVAACIVGLSALSVGLKPSYYEIAARRAWVEAWDNQDKLMSQAHKSGQPTYVATALGHTGELFDISDDPDHWINVCYAKYYGFEKVYKR